MKCVLVNPTCNDRYGCGDGGFDLLWRIEKVSHKIKLIRTDKAYNGDFSDKNNYRILDGVLRAE
ncbi:hypothetical protein SAMN05661012_00457 [Chitinophaga sancti]|uniref:Uncharacterized protein n=1 Tax=Chitinophaga sancti TaxID=1004 RepID=A0A1K1M539_9BACT|nr:hypothetical protein SAMN05661012_00457 [Chitinophaga sancti]